MKKLSCFILFILILNIMLNATVMKIEDKYINDYAKILKETDKKSLTELLIKFYKIKDIEITIVIIDSLRDYIKDDISFEEYVKKFFNSENIKFIKKQNAILLFIAIKDRKLHFESGEKISANIISLLSNIIDNKIIPFFKNEEYSRGIYDGVREFIRKTEKIQNGKIKISVELFYISAGILLFLIGLSLLLKNKKKKTKVIEEFGKGAYGKWE